ncbi:hypothetical protein B0I37DRAFT_13059 [Chaetomium sp. MPI-CAGE-AT-0009]|nr:hypothetical protein B0I37DRAFT_13059 [Chaetomium sp. MPI-CAGE-AT-0009]
MRPLMLCRMTERRSKQVVTPKCTAARATVVEMESSEEVAGSWRLRLLSQEAGGSFPNRWDQDRDGGFVSFLASDRLAGRSIQFAAGVEEATSPDVRSTATPEQRLVETAQGLMAMGGVASDDGTDVSNCHPHFKAGNFKSKYTTDREMRRGPLNSRSRNVEMNRVPFLRGLNGRLQFGCPANANGARNLVCVEYEVWPPLREGRCCMCSAENRR